MSGSNSGPISFPNIPTNLRIHGAFVDIIPQANQGQQTYQTLIIGQVLAGSPAAAVAGIPLICAGIADGATQGGVGSQLALMTAQYKGSDPFATVYYLPLLDDSASVAATLAVTVAGTATAAGVLSLYVAGVLVPVAVALGAAAAVVAASIVAAVTAAQGLIPCTAAATGAVVTFTAINKGLCGNEVDLRLNYYGSSASESVPPGLTFTNLLVATGTQLTGGAQNPTTLAAALANLGTQQFDIIVFPYTDSVSLNTFQTFMNNTAGRWSWLQQLYGGGFSAIRGTLGTAVTALTARNDPAISIMPFNNAPQPAWIWAAEIAAQCAISIRANVAVPLQEIILNLMPPPIQSRYLPGDRNTLLFDGGSTFTVNAAGQVVTDRLATTYQLNAAGLPDASYLDVETRYCLAFASRDIRRYLSAKYSRKIFVADFTRVSGTINNAIVTPSMIKASVITRYAYLCDIGVMQDLADFTANVRVVKVGSQAQIYYPGNVANQLRQIEVLMDFFKS